jgi:hypothetical protein
MSTTYPDPANANGAYEEIVIEPPADATVNSLRAPDESAREERETLVGPPEPEAGAEDVPAELRALIAEYNAIVAKKSGRPAFSREIVRYVSKRLRHGDNTYAVLRDAVDLDSRASDSVGAESVQFTFEWVLRKHIEEAHSKGAK